MFNCSDTLRSDIPKSPVVQQVIFAPQSQIIVLGKGSDNWPTTWADDNLLYTAYGDGWGFEPKTEKKLSLGLARISGTPPNITGSNIRTRSGEQFGQGPKGKKASGLLMVDGVIYMWVRNANNNGEQSQLAWSKDRGKSWEWSTWAFQEFGYCTFINYGQNYQGARGDYVYTISHDHPNAYERADRFILMRVPKNRIRNLEAYQFFNSVDTNGDPVWTAKIEQRGAVFTDNGRCHRSGISYNQALGRYFWWQSKAPPKKDGRFVGMFGIYDAPEPWGPWTSVYYTEDWDVGAGETGSFPPKWMSEDGKTLYLIFSGNDSFSVREVTILLKSDGAK